MQFHALHTPFLFFKAITKKMAMRSSVFAFVAVLLLLVEVPCIGADDADHPDHQQCTVMSSAGSSKQASGTSSSTPSERDEEENLADVEEVSGAREERGAETVDKTAGEEKDARFKALLLVGIVVCGAFGVILTVVCCVDDNEASGIDPKNEEMLELISKHYLPPCENCGTKHKGNRFCQGCQVVAYCSEECEKVHHARHEAFCERLAALRAKHTENPQTPQDAAGQNPFGNAMRRGYFVDWQKTNTHSILKDVAAYFVKYWANMVTESLSSLEKAGKGLLLVDVSTERFKDLHSTEDPVRIMYITYGQLRGNAHFALFTCDTVLSLLQGYDPRTSSVVAFTNGLSYLEVCPVYSMRVIRFCTVYFCEPPLFSLRYGTPISYPLHELG